MSDRLEPDEVNELLEKVKDATSDGELEQLMVQMQAINDEDVKNQCSLAAVSTAALSGRMEVLQFLFRELVDEPSREQCSGSALECAAESGRIEVLKFVLDNFVDPRVRDQCCLKAVESAAYHGHMDSVRHLVESTAGEHAKDQCRLKAVEFAINGEHFDVAKSVLSTVADQNVKEQCCLLAAESSILIDAVENLDFLLQNIASQNMKDLFNTTAVKYAADALGDIEVVKRILNQIDDPNVKDQCCIMAAQFYEADGRINDVSFLIQSASDPDVKDQCCMKAADSAAVNGEIDIVKFLVQAIANQSVRDQCCKNACESAASNGELAVVTYLAQTLSEYSRRDQCFLVAAISAARNGHMDVVSYLVGTISDDNLRRECTGRAVVIAATRGHERIVGTLGISPEWLHSSSNQLVLLNFLSVLAIRGDNLILNGTLSLMQPAQVTQLLCLSIAAGHVSLALTLLANVSKVDLPDSSGATALMLAADAGHHELIVKLLDIGASVRAEDSQGRTALSRACQAGHVRVAKTLADKGSVASHRDHQGRTCVQLAEQFGQTQVLQLLNEKRNDFYTSGRSENRHDFCEKQVPADDLEADARLSVELHRLFNLAGFTQQRAQCQQEIADLLQGISRDLTLDISRQMTGSYADGWANSLGQVNGRTAADSDIDWTLLIPGQEFHLNGGCERKWPECKDATQLQVTEGHAQVLVGSGSQPAIAVKASGVRPAVDTCYAIQCCSSFCKARIQALAEEFDPVHLVRATRPDSPNEFRVSYSFQEKCIIRHFNTIQGQLFTIIKFMLKRHLPRTLGTHGLKTYHAKTLLFFMMEKHGKRNRTVWQPQNLIALLKESLDMMLSFINTRSSPDECMPHFFMPDAPLYFKNAGIGGDFDNTTARVRDRLSELRSDISNLVEEMKNHVRPLQSEMFYFHPFTLLPLTSLAEVTEIGSLTQQFSDLYSVLHQCLTSLQAEACERSELMKQLSLLQQLQWCKCAALCMTAMAHLKFGDSMEAETLAMDLAGHTVTRGFTPKTIQGRKHDYANYWIPLDSDWAWRFCFPCITQPHFPFLPEFTRTLFTARLSQPRSSHLYVNFRCLSWSLQAELLHNHAAVVSAWRQELEEDPDLEELLTLAHYSDCREHLQFCLSNMETIRDEKRVAMETQDEVKIEWVKQKLHRLSMENADTTRDAKVVPCQSSDAASLEPSASDQCLMARRNAHKRKVPE